MKNLLNHLSLEEIEQIPEGRFKGDFRHGKVINGQRWKDEKRWDNRAETILFNLCRKIIRGSVGQKWDDIYSKLCKLTKNVKYDFDLQWVIRGSMGVHIPFWHRKLKRWHYMHFWGYSQDLYNNIKRIKLIMYRNFGYEAFYWVCPYTGVLKMIQATGRKPSKQSKEAALENRRKWDKYYKEKAEEKKRIDDFAFSMRNKHPVLRAYSSWLSKKYYAENEMSKLKYTDKTWYELKKQWLEQDLKKAEDEIKKIEQGDYSGVNFDQLIYLNIKHGKTTI